MKYVVYMFRILCGGFSPLLPVLVPAVPLWQILGGILYGILIPFSVGFLDIHAEDMLDVLRQLPMLVAKRCIVRIAIILAIWLVVWVLWPSFLIFTLKGALAVYFILASLLGTAVYVLLVDHVRSARAPG